MAHRAKHRWRALLKRVATGRRIKSDETPQGQEAYERARAFLVRLDQEFNQRQKAGFWK